MMRPIAFTILALFVATTALAQSEPEQSGCFFLDRECIGKERIQQRKAERERQETARREKYLQDKSQRETERAEAVRLKTEQSAQASREVREQKDAKAEEESQQRELKYQQLKAEQAKRRAEMEAESVAEGKRERAAQKKRDAETADLKVRCGADYKSPSIGMRIERVQECVSPVKLVSQLNRADGVVSTYRSGTLTVHAMSGRVMAWDR